MMRRREFITLLGGAATAWPIGASAQQGERMRRVGMLIGGSAEDPSAQRYIAVFLDAMAKLGWTEGRNLRIDLHYALGDFGHVRASAAEIVRLAPDAIFTSSGNPTLAMTQETSTIPIVFTGPSNVVPAETNIARPQANVTGFPILYPSIAAKWVELLREVDPRISQVGLIRNPAGRDFGGSSYVGPIEEAALGRAMRAVRIPFQNAGELEQGVAAFGAPRGGGLIVIPGTETATRENRDLIRHSAEQHRLPVIHFDRDYPNEGGLMSYGSNYEDLVRRAAVYVDRILRGAKVSELPVERPNKFELIINLKAAKAIGLEVPPSLLARADEVIE
jgi:putative ABC transport system substrate-binding protein